MPRYLLFAARDGDTLRSAAMHPDEVAAQSWAGREIVREFCLEQVDQDDFEAVLAETDGVILEEVSPDVRLALQITVAQLSVVSAVADHLSGSFDEEVKSWRRGILSLIMALQEAELA